MGDMNAKIGEGKDGHVIGPCGLGIQEMKDGIALQNFVKKMI